MSEFRGREFKIIIAVLLLSGSFLFFGNVKNSKAVLLNSYTKLYNGTLSAQEWNNLASDFLKTYGAVSMTGPLGVGTTTIPGSGILVDGPIIASNFSGPVTGGIDAANVMGGNGSIFGSTFGSGASYSFSGNVGIGTAGPTEKLQVSQALTSGNSVFLKVGDTTTDRNVKVGTLYVAGDQPYPGIWFSQATPSASNYSFWYEDGQVNFNSQSGYSMQFRNANNTKMVIDSSGNVGIGTTTIGAKLDVLGSLRAGSATISNITNGVVMADASGNLYATSSFAATGLPSPVGISGQTLRSDGTNWLANSLLFNNGTNVGIGTTTLTAKLGIQGAGADILNLFDSAGAKKVSILNSGNVGIGVTNPGAKLSILGGDSLLTSFAANISGSTGTGLVVANNGSVGIGGNPINGASLYVNRNLNGINWNAGFAVNTTVTDNVSGQNYFNFTTTGIFNPSANNSSNYTGTSNQVSKKGNYSAGAVNINYSSFGSWDNGSISTVRMFYSRAGFESGTTGSINNLYHFFVDVPYGTGTIGTAYGLYIAKQKQSFVTNGYGIYQVDSADKNYFAGNVGIGAATYGATLDIGGALGSLRAKSGTLSNIGSGVIMADASGNLYSTTTAAATGIPSPSGIAGQTLRSNGTNWLANNLLFNDGTNVGIGTTTPSQKLEVLGSIRSSNASGAYAIISPDQIEIRRPDTTTEQGTRWSTTAGQDWKMYQPVGSSNFTFWTDGGGGNVMTLLTGGNVGVGTISPGTTLDVGGATGSFRAKSGTLSNIGSGIIMADGSGNLYSTSSLAAITAGWTVNGTTVYKTDINGNVGIGTTAPGAKAEIYDAGSSTKLILNGRDAMGNSGGLEVRWGTDSTNMRAQLGINSWDGFMSLVNGSNVNTVNVSSGGISYFNGGNVGIGTTNPGAKLDVSGGINIAASNWLTFGNSGPGGSPAGFVWNLTNDAASMYATEISADQTDYVFKMADNATSDRFVWWIQEWQGAAYDVYPMVLAGDYGNFYNGRLFINNDTGNVGIATTNPGTTLDVGGATGSFRAKSGTLSNIGSGIIMADGSGNLYSTSSLAAITAGWTVNGTTVYKTDINGNVGIGTTGPGYKLDVNGDLRVSGVTNVETSADQILQLKQLGIAGTAGVKDGGWNYMAFVDSENDRQAYFGIDPSGDFVFNPEVTGSKVVTYSNLTISNNSLTQTGSYNNSFAGNVGIGTTNPGQRLDVNGAITLSGVGAGMATLSAVSTSPDAGFKYDAPGAASGWYGTHDFYTGYNGGASTLAMRIKNGNVGIGTTDPGATLDVAGAIASFRAKSATLSSIGAGLIMADASGNLYSTTTAAATGIPSPAGLNGQTLRSNGTNWIANNLLFNDGTNVGVGTTTAVYKLEVDGSFGAISNSSSIILDASGNISIGI